MTQNNLLTQDGFQKLTRELEDLKKKQEHLVTQIEEVAQPDESGWDGLVQQLKEELEVVLDKIDKLASVISNAKIINQSNINDSVVDVGNLVKLKLAGNQESYQFQIVNHLEANPAENKISDQSPLGQALLGRKVNDRIEVDAPVGKLTYKIIDIS